MPQVVFPIAWMKHSVAQAGRLSWAVAMAPKAARMMVVYCMFAVKWLGRKSVVWRSKVQMNVVVVAKSVDSRISDKKSSHCYIYLQTNQVGLWYKKEVLRRWRVDPV